MSLPVRVSDLWRSRSALYRAREISLSIHEKIMNGRQAHEKEDSVGKGLAFQHAHSGAAHVDYFREELRGIGDQLPEAFRALEIGAGMGWLAALLASENPMATVLASEILWGDDRPTSEPNAHTLYRMEKEESQLSSVAEFHFDEEKELRSVSFSDRLKFLRASADALPLDGASIDFIYSLNCLEHLPDLYQSMNESWRVLREGGIVQHATEPLFYSPFGHHLVDMAPIPWGHLLWEEEDFAKRCLNVSSTHYQWSGNQQFSEEHIVEEILPTLNGVTPSVIRRSMRLDQWELVGWLEIMEPGAEQWFEEMRLWEVFDGLDVEALMMKGIRYRAQKTSSARFWRSPALYLPVTTRLKLKSLIGR